MSSWLRPTKFHHITSCSGNGGPPSSTTRAGLSAAVDQLQTVAPGGLECQIGHVERGTRDLDAALVEQHAVLEDGIDVEGEVGTRVEVELRAEQRSEGVHG